MYLISFDIATFRLSIRCKRKNCHRYYRFKITVVIAGATRRVEPNVLARPPHVRRRHLTGIARTRCCQAARYRVGRPGGEDRARARDGAILRRLCRGIHGAGAISLSLRRERWRLSAPPAGRFPKHSAWIQLHVRP